MTIRLLAAAAVLVSAAVHLDLWFNGMKGVDVVGPAFLVNAVGGAVIALLLIVWRHWVPPLLALGFGLSTLTAFVIAATVGLFGVQTGWAGWSVWTAAAAEVVAIVTGAVLLFQENRRRSPARLQGPTAAGSGDLD